MSVELVFETHSITVDNEAGIATGWGDGQLSARGRALAARLGERRRNDGVDAVFSSDLGRAVETARIAFAGAGITVYFDARLRECDYGRWNGMPVDRLAAERRHRIGTPFPDGESYLEVVERVAGFLADLAEGWDGRRVMVVGHSATRWALDHLLVGVPLEDLVDAPFEWREGWQYIVQPGFGRLP